MKHYQSQLSMHSHHLNGSLYKLLTKVTEESKTAIFYSSYVKKSLHKKENCVEKISKYA